MASKSLPSSSGYFNKKMLSILDAGEKKPANKNTTATKTQAARKSKSYKGSVYECDRNSNS